MESNVILSPEEARVLACLVEKELTTPDSYPLTLNSLLAACNQKSSRFPVVNYDSATVEAAIAVLKHHGFLRAISGAEHRVPKYRHDMPFILRLNPAQTAVLTVLMLRGPQTVGEIRGRTDRMHEFDSLEEVADTLRDLKDHLGRALVVELERLPGTKEPRFAHLLSGPPDESLIAAAAAPARSIVRQDSEESATLRQELEETRLEVLALAEKLETVQATLGVLQQEFASFRKQFE